MCHTCRPGCATPDAELQAIVRTFNAWVADSRPSVHSIKAQWVGSGMRVGVVATRDVAAGDVYLAVPQHHNVPRVRTTKPAAEAAVC